MAAADLGRSDGTLQLGDPFLIPPIERPLPDPLRLQQAGLRQDAQVLAGGRLADAQFFGDEETAHAVTNQVAVLLRREVGFGVLEPFENREAALVGHGLDQRRSLHRP